MDAVTQVALGAAVGEVTLGRRLGVRAAAWGGLVAALPDVDMVLTPLLSDLAVLTTHRSLTHSILFCLLAPPLLGWALAKINHAQRDAVGVRGWTLLAFLAISTHVLLDCCTTYGTQLAWPFSDAPVSFRLVSVIDPAVTLPLLLGLGLALRLPRDQPGRRRVAAAGLTLALAYLGWAVVAKRHVGGVLRDALAAQGVTAQRTLTKPTLFNTILWRVVAEDERGYWVGYWSFLDPDRAIQLVFHPRGAERLGGWGSSPPVRDLIRITDGYYAVTTDTDGTLLINDVRYGQWVAWTPEPSPYVFAYRLEGDLSAPPRVVTRQRDFTLTKAHRRGFLARIRGVR